MRTKTVELNETQIVVSRQSLLTLVRALDIGMGHDRLPAVLDDLREPFFQDEIASGQARTDGSMNKYLYSAN